LGVMNFSFGVCPEATASVPAIQTAQATNRFIMKAL